MSDGGKPEFSRLIGRDELARGPQSLELTASAAERVALAHRFGLLDLDRLEARVSLAPRDRGRLIMVEGHLSAAATQECVVTLEPVASEIEEDFSQLYSLAPDETPQARELVVDPEAEDPPEPLGPSGLDLGEALAQQLALALEAYPRAAGAALDRSLGGQAADPAEEGPFAELLALKRPQ